LKIGSGHKAEELTDAVLTVINSYNIGISYLRGQIYDNAINMSGQYSGLQARIKEINPLAEYIPCSAHSLILIGTYAASCCKNACNFFNLLQSIYTFFSTSTSRWEILSASVKELSTIRWSAREDACRSLNNNWDRIISALKEIKNNDKQKAQTRCEAKGILKSLSCFENNFMSIFWGDLLERFNAVSKKLQSIDINLHLVV